MEGSKEPKRWRDAAEPPSLEGVGAKLIRARDHFHTLHESSEEAVKKSAGKPFVVREGDWEVVRIPLGKFPVWPSIYSGDYAHNLRSALDHLIWQLVKVCGGEPGTWNAFPAYGNEDDFIRDVKERANKRGPGPLDGIPKDGPIWTLIESYQPYKNTKLPPWMPTDMMYPEKWKSRLTFLGVLGALNNVDKHRTIHGFNAYFPSQGQAINDSVTWNSDAVLVEQKDRKSWEPLEDRAELVRFRFRPGVEPNVRVTGPVLLKAGFEAEFAPEEGVTVLLGSMQTLGEGIEAIIASFREFFPE